jgi:hypothetical protein
LGKPTILIKNPKISIKIVVENYINIQFFIVFGSCTLPGYIPRKYTKYFNLYPDDKKIHSMIYLGICMDLNPGNSLDPIIYYHRSNDFVHHPPILPAIKRARGKKCSNPKTGVEQNLKGRRDGKLCSLWYLAVI